MAGKPNYQEPGWGSALNALLDQLSADIRTEADARASAVAQVEASARETFLPRAGVGAANGLAPLDTNARLSVDLLPVTVLETLASLQDRLAALEAARG